MIGHAVGTDITRYAALMHHGRYAAAYLGVGLGQYGTRMATDGGDDGTW